MAAYNKWPYNIGSGFAKGCNGAEDVGPGCEGVVEQQYPVATDSAAYGETAWVEQTLAAMDVG